MIFTLLGIVVLGVATAGMLSMLFRVLGLRPPRGVLPIVAGLTMFGFVIWNDYSWFSRTRGALPASYAVAAQYPEQTWYQPWTYIRSPIHRFIAVDHHSLRRHPAAPGTVLAHLLFIARYQNTVASWQFYDCDTPRRADAGGVSTFDGDGLPQDLDWVPLAADDALRQEVCQAV